MTGVGHCKGVVVSSFIMTRQPGCKLGLPSTIDDAAASSGDNQLTSAARTAVPVVDTFATWKAC